MLVGLSAINPQQRTKETQQNSKQPKRLGTTSEPKAANCQAKVGDGPSRRLLLDNLLCLLLFVVFHHFCLAGGFALAVPRVFWVCPPYIPKHSKHTRGTPTPTHPTQKKKDRGNNKQTSTKTHYQATVGSGRSLRPLLDSCLCFCWGVFPVTFVFWGGLGFPREFWGLSALKPERSAPINLHDVVQSSCEPKSPSTPGSDAPSFGRTPEQFWPNSVQVLPHSLQFWPMLGQIGANLVGRVQIFYRCRPNSADIGPTLVGISLNFAAIGPHLAEVGQIRPDKSRSGSNSARK